jgi:hypothetical protein
MKSSHLILTGVLLLLAGGAYGQTPAATAKTAGEAMKNVHVMTDVPAKEWNDTMWFMSTSLGVGCDHCHMGQAYEKDDRKAKQTARSMILMTREINAKNFGGRLVVTCNSCHQGSLKPKASPALWSKTPEELAALRKEQQQKEARAATPEAVAAVPKEASPQPDAEQVLTDYRKAVGGEGIKSLAVKAKVTFDVRGPVELELEMVMPDRLRQHAIVGGADLWQYFSVDHGWIIAPGRTVEMTPANMEGVRNQMNFFGPMKLPAGDAPRKAVGLEKIGGRTFAVVESRTPARLERLYFDVQTGLLYRNYRETFTSLGSTPDETILEDYRDVGGVQMPFQITLRSPNDRTCYTFSEINIDGPIDPARFERPPAATGMK